MTTALDNLPQLPNNNLVTICLVNIPALSQYTADSFRSTGQSQSSRDVFAFNPRNSSTFVHGHFRFVDFFSLSPSNRSRIESGNLQLYQMIKCLSFSFLPPLGCEKKREKARFSSSSFFPPSFPVTLNQSPALPAPPASKQTCKLQLLYLMPFLLRRSGCLLTYTSLHARKYWLLFGEQEKREEILINTAKKCRPNLCGHAGLNCPKNTQTCQYGMTRARYCGRQHDRPILKA